MMFCIKTVHPWVHIVSKNLIHILSAAESHWVDLDSIALQFQSRPKQEELTDVKQESLSINILSAYMCSLSSRQRFCLCP